MSLPIVMIFERHWDLIPKQVVEGLIPELAEHGYNTLALEAYHDLSEEDIVKGQLLKLEEHETLQKTTERYLANVGIVATLSEMSFSSLAELCRLYVSSQRFIDVAEIIKNLPAARVIKTVLECAQKHSLSIQGIDIASCKMRRLMAVDLTKRMKGLDVHEEERIATMTQHLLDLRREGRGVVFMCGALHAGNVIAKLREKGLSDDEMLYYFPYSHQRFEADEDDINLLRREIPTLESFSHLLEEGQVRSFRRRVICEVISKITYTREIPGDSSRLRVLRNIFSEHVRMYVRPGYQVDALLSLEDLSHMEEMLQKLRDKKITYVFRMWNQRIYLAIPSVNNRRVAEKIKEL